MSFFTWLASLFSSSPKQTIDPAPVPAPETPARGDPLWLQLAKAELGTKEGPGDANNPVVLKYYADAGHPEINADSVAWCAAFAGAMLERAGYPCSKQLNARSYLTWGKAVSKPYPGCIAVFSRGDPRGWEGHVGFFLEEDEKGIQILAGNQGDAVSVGYEPKSRLLGYRQPVTAMNSRTMKASTVQMGLFGIDSAVILDSQQQVSAIADLFGQIGVTVAQFLIVSIVLKIALQCMIIWARQDDAKTKGR